MYLNKPCHALAFILWACAMTASSQLCTINGIVEDALTGDPLIGAYVKSGDAVIATDLDGMFSILVPNGISSLEVSYIGYARELKQVSCVEASTYVRFQMETLVMKEAVVSADVVISRKTPVAFTNVLPAQIQEELAGRDLPLVLNTTPGVYATSQGGGDGDARVTIRGFDQTNLAVMVDGVPMNDMENGWVYWSNWAGLDLVVRTTQVQRGLGASKLAIPSVGGTINILTGGDESANGSINYQTEMGSYGYSRNSISGVFGSQRKGFLHFVGSYKTNQGFAEGLESEAYAYYIKGRKTIGNHNLSITTFGAPQRHGQRSYQMQVYEYDTNLAEELINSEGDLSSSEYQDMLNGLSETAILNRGLNFNEFIVNYQEVYYTFNEESGELDKSFGEFRRYNPRQNQYFKPIVTIRDVWSLSDRSSLTTTAYASFGRGGGEALNSTPGIRLMDGTINLQETWNSHQLFEFGPNGLNLDDNGERSGSNFIRIAHNDHRWFGALSNFTSTITEHLTFSAGVDARHYTGSHYRSIGDLFGADYYDAPEDRRDQNSDFDTPLRTGDKYYYHDDGQVAWGGAYSQIEIEKYNFSAFINISGAQSWYRAIDYFRPKVITLNDTTYEVRSTDEYRVLGDNEWRENDYSPYIVRGVHGPSSYAGDVLPFLTSDHPGLTTYKTDWERLNSATIKAGGSYNFNEWFNAYTNLGYLSRAPLFNSVFDINNNLIDGYANQFVKAVEFGVKYSRENFATNINAYRTGWENKPVNRFYGLSGLWKDSNLSVYADTSTVAGREFMIELAESNSNADEWNEVATSVIEDVDRNLGYNLLDADAIHSGIEWDFSYDPTKKFNIQGVFSFGNWRWTSNESVQLINRTTNEFITRLDDNAIADTLVNLDGVKVGDAAQRQISFACRYSPKPGTYFSIRNTYFWQHYAQFSPGDVITDGEPKDVWITPAYFLLDFNAGTSFNVSDNAVLRLRLSITNSLNSFYITDATNNSEYANNAYGLEGGSGRAEVFVGPPRMLRLSAVLELKGLQKRILK